LHTPDLLVLQATSESETQQRAPRIQELNARVAELAEECGIFLRSYSRAQILAYFARYGVSTKQTIAETIARQIPALNLYVPPAQKAWRGEDPRMGIFEAAALAWMYFEEANG